MTTVLAALLIGQIAAGSASDTIDSAHIRAEYVRLFPIEVHTIPHGHGRALTHADADLSRGHPLLGLAEEHQSLLRYLVLHGTGFSVDSILMPELDSAAVVRRYHERLRADSLFNARIMPVVARYAAARKLPLSPDLQHHVSSSRRMVRLQDVLDAAARFYYPDWILPDGRVQVHICVGVNGFRDVPPARRDPHVEALAYATIRRDQLFRIQTGRPSTLIQSMHADFDVVKREPDLPSDPAARLRELQRRVWARLERNEELRRAIIAEYEKQREILPIAIADIPTS